MHVLIGCEESATVREAFCGLGHLAVSCDLKPSRIDGAHYRGDVFDVIDYPWHLGIFHPACTGTAVSGARHFYEKWKDGRQAAGVSFFMRLWKASQHIERVAFEHPVSIMSTLFRKPDQIIQPWMFGQYETKATCLWLRNLPKLVPHYKTADELREDLALPPGTEPRDRIHKMPPGPQRAAERSKTYTGIAHAMADQWSKS